MQIALIGFSKSGKTTVFNALTGANAETSAFASGKAKTHRAVVQVPDPRLDQLCALFESKKFVPATIDYIDPVGIRRDEVGRGTSLGDEMLNTIATADALVAVVRAFEDASGVASDPTGDFETIWLELVLSDLAKVDNRLTRVIGQAQRAPTIQRAALAEEQAILERLKAALEAGRPVRALDLSPEDARLLRSFQFLTTKPLLVVVNGGGTDAAAYDDLIARLAAFEHSHGEKGDALVHFMALCGQTEMEIAQLDPADREAFLAEYGIAEAGMARMIRLSYDVLGLISFFTVGPPEAHAWTLRRGLPVVEAAGVIHSDLQRGFIRAQVVSWDALLEHKTMAESKKHAKLRLEGREYIVQDGDVIEVMFSV
jgi:GTP-binding protein YchF